VDGSYSLHGYKWFSSATDSDMALTLARVADNQVNGLVPPTALFLYLQPLLLLKKNTNTGKSNVFFRIQLKMKKKINK
jgi:hypothetical protein